jgi:prepilin-type processing-associated H-X9-DG protein/prepilin-type N-terminal cleavage/methylation domain-containing protein
MKHGLTSVRRPTEDFRRPQLAPSRTPSGFSLIELLVVAALLLLLFTLYWGSSASGNQQRRALADCQVHLQKIHVAMAIYANDHAGRFPVAPGARTSAAALDALVPRYTVDTAAFICPGSKDSLPPAGQSIRQRRISYAYYMGRRVMESQQVLMSDQQVDDGSRKVGEYAFSASGKPPGNNHGKRGGNFLFCDGHAESSPAQVPFSVLLTPGVVLLNPTPHSQ